MLQRPKVGETEDDLLHQQEEFLKASGKEPEMRKRHPGNEEKVSKQFEILGDIVEKKPEFCKPVHSKFVQGKGFPASFAIDLSLAKKRKGKSLFAQQIDKNKNIDEEQMEVDETPSLPDTHVEHTPEFNQTEKTIHEENLQKLSNMTEEEILEEQKKLLATLDSNLVNFLKNRRKGKEISIKKDEIKTEKRETVEAQVDEEEEVKKNLEKYVDSKWINMDFIEKEKLEWIGDIPDRKSLEPDQPYSARFDFQGSLQPFTTDIDVRNSLYHHGEEPNRPGYTIQELYQLSRSQVLQQRILALNTLANIIRKTKLGYYDRCFDGQLLNKLVESDLFFLLRFSIDENPLIPASVNCLHSLVCNESDEFCLDKLMGVTYWDEQPLLFLKIEANKDEEKELKDHIVIGNDMIRGVLRTDLLIRLAYVLSNFSPTRETTIRVLNCLIRISRHSLEATNKIFETTNLLKIVYSNIKAKAPVYEGVKLFRVIISQSRELAVRIVETFDVKYLVVFIEAEENSNITKKEFYLLKLETIYLWRSLLLHDLFINEFLMWSPCLVRLLLFYTQKVDVSGENDFDFELFSAMTSLIIVCNRKKISTDSNILLMMRVCLEKWLVQLMQRGRYNFAVSKAIGCAFRYFTSYFKAFGISPPDLEFIKKIKSVLVLLFQSEVFNEMSDSLRRYSFLLSSAEVKRDPDNLPSLCSVYDGGEEFLRIVQNSSTIPFFISLVKYLKASYRVSHDSKTVIKLFTECDKLRKYISKICQFRSTPQNWFMKFETAFLTDFLQLLSLVNDKKLLDVSFRILPLLRIDDKNAMKVLKKIFDKNNWGVEFVDHLELLCSELLLKPKQKSQVLNFKNDLVPEEWLYKILSLLRGKDSADAVANILNFIALILYRKSELLNRISHTLRYYHLCSVFLTDSNVFDSRVQNALEETFSDVVSNRAGVNLNLKYDKNKSFYDLYTELITQYAGVSYGLQIFAQFVLFPLQNRFNLSFRKLIWFEYLHVLRVITLPVGVTSFVNLGDFVEPCETDESLLVAYINSVSNNVIMKKRNPFVYNIAVGNVKTFLTSKSEDVKLLTFLKNKVDTLKNEELKNDILCFDLSR